MRMVRWVIWHCPPDAGLEIRTLVVWGRARYLLVTEAPHNIEYLQDSLYLYNLKARVWFEPAISIFPSKQLLITVPGSPPGLDNIPFRWLLVVPHIILFPNIRLVVDCCWLLLLNPCCTESPATYLATCCSRLTILIITFLIAIHLLKNML